MPALRDEIREAIDEVVTKGPPPAALEARVLSGVREEVAFRDRSTVSWPLAVAAAFLAALVVGGLVLGVRSFRPAPVHRPPHAVYPPASNLSRAVGYDPVRHELVVVASAAFGKASTYTWDGSSWSPASGQAPLPTALSSVVYDSTRRELLLFTQQGAWRWNGRWQRLSVAFSPVTPDTMVADDPATKQVVAYTAGTGTWGWNGTEWTSLAQPAQLEPYGLAYDGRRLILLGGDPSGSATQTWDWTGSRWTQLEPAAAPPGGGGYALGMAGGNHIVAYGGGYRPFPSDDTWAWDASAETWKLESAGRTPGPRFGEFMGGNLLYGGDQLNDIWTWTGSTWKQVSAGTVATPRDSGERVAAAAVPAAIARLHPGVGLVLVPSSPPAGLTQGWVQTANPTNGDPVTLAYGYYDAARTRSIEISVVVPGNSNLAAANKQVAFRGTTAYYQYFPGPPVRPLSLWWTEQGTPYVLGAQGLTESQFFQIGSSLQPLAAASGGLQLDTIRMTSSTQGWAVDTLDGSAPELLLTDDGGQSWRDVTPAGFVALLHVSTSGAWVALASQAGGTQVVISQSSDGAKWTPSTGTIAGLAGPRGDLMSFVAAQAWLVVPGEPSSQDQQQGATIYHSADGGASWSRLSQITTGSALFQCGKSGIGFASYQTGWITGGCLGAYTLLVTHDGGKTWAKQSLAVPPGESSWQSACSAGPCSIAAPVFWTSTQGEMAVYGQHPYVYLTGDGGQTWRAHRVPGDNGQIVFIDQSRAVASVSTGANFALESSADGSVTWTAIATNVNAELGSLTCTSASDCWGVDTSGSSPGLWATTDGGRTWTLLPARRSAL